MFVMHRIGDHEDDDLRFMSLDDMPETCLIITESSTSTRVNGRPVEPSTTATRLTVKCRVENTERTANEDLVAGSVVANVARRIHVPLGTPVKLTSRIEVGGNAYQVSSMDDDVTGRVDLAVVGQRVGAAKG